MHSWKTTVCCLIAGVMLCGQAFARNYIIDENGKQRNAESISSDPGGQLTINVEGGSFKKRYVEIKRVVTDKPAPVAAAEAALDAGDYAKVLTTLSDELFAQQRFLGWGAYIQHLRARAFLSQGKANDAEQKLIDGMQYASREGREALLQADLVQALVDQKKNDRARELIATIQPSSPDDLAALYNMQGKMLSSEGKKREALLKHLAVIWIFEKADVDARRMAYTEAISLMKELKDLRHTKLSEEMAAEFSK